MHFNYQIKNQGTLSHIFFIGPVDIHFLKNAKDIEKQLKPTCVFNLRGVNHINSMGIRSWWEMFFLLSQDKMRTFKFEEVSWAMVKANSWSPESFSWGEVVSVMLSWSCESCGGEQEVLYPVDDLYDLIESDTSIPCKVCGGESYISEEFNVGSLAGPEEAAEQSKKAK